MREDAGQEARRLEARKPESAERTKKVTLTRHTPKGGAASTCPILNADGRYWPNEGCGKELPPRGKQYWLSAKGHEVLYAIGNGLRQRLRVTGSLTGGERAIGVALPRKGRMEARRVRTAAAQSGQKIKVRPKSPGLRQSKAKLTGSNMRAERCMYLEPEQA